MISHLKTVVKSSLLISSLAIANMPPNGFRPYLNDYFVETGTNVGRSVKQALNAGFKTIHSIEISNKIAHWTTQTFKNHSNVHIWQGDSGSILYDVIKDIDAPITFWLDATDGTQELKAENTPIMRELDAIKQHHIKNHTLLIDDIGCAGTRSFDFITKESIITKIKEINPNYVIRYIAGGDDAECPNNIMVAQVPESRSAYLDPAITSRIDKNEVNFILELGAYDCRETIELYNYYKCPVISFECAPESIRRARSLIQSYPAIKLVEKAGWNASKKIDFYYCTEHPSASSCFFFDYEIMARRDGQSIHQMVKRYPIKSVNVEATRLDEWLKNNGIDQVDMLCMSIQGSALPVLEGLGSYLRTVKYVVTQMVYQRMYKDEALFSEINRFMEENGFTVFNATPDGFFNFVVYVRNDMCRH